MSKLIFKLYLILGISAIYSQTYEDALRYNQFYHEGSSRFNSMGGAFGALGGDLSSININPAGSSIFLKSELGFTLNFKNQEIKNDFNQFISNSKDNLYSYNHIGLVLVYDINKTKFSLGYNMNRLNDFNNHSHLADLIIEVLIIIFFIMLMGFHSMIYWFMKMKLFRMHTNTWETTLVLEINKPSLAFKAT